MDSKDINNITYEQLYSINEMYKKIGDYKLQLWFNLRKESQDDIDEMLPIIGSIFRDCNKLENIGVKIDIMLHNFRNVFFEHNVFLHSSEVYMIMEMYMSMLQKSLANEMEMLIKEYADKGILLVLEDRILSFFNKESSYLSREKEFIKKYSSYYNTISSFDMCKDFNQIYDFVLSNYSDALMYYDKDDLDENCNYELEKLGYDVRVGNKKVPLRKNSNIINKNLDIMLNKMKEIENSDDSDALLYLNNKVVDALDLYGSGKYDEYDKMLDEIKNFSKNLSICSDSKSLKKNCNQKVYKKCR